MHTVHGTGLHAPESGIAFLPKRYRRDGTAPGILYLHGASETETMFLGRPTNLGLMANLLTDAGYPGFAPYMGGDSFGNATSRARITDARAYLQGAMGARAGKVILLGASMGGLAAMTWLKDNMPNVACAVLIAPACDTGDLVVNNRAGMGSVVNTAYGAVTKTCSTTIGSSVISCSTITAADQQKAVWGPGIPADSQVGSVTAGVSFILGNQQGQAVAATATGAGVGLQIGGYQEWSMGSMYNPATFRTALAGLRAYVAYGTADSVVPPSTVTTVTAAMGATATVVGLPHDHGANLVNAVDVGAVMAFVNTYGWAT